MAGKNPSFVLRKAGEVAFEERPVPELKSDDDVLVEIKQTGICGSDVHYWVSGAIGTYVVRAPMVLGHESSGVVTQVGPAVKSLEAGDRVALEPGVPCRRCTRCKAGTYNLCPDMAFAATPPFDGTLARYYVLPEDLCYRLPAHVSLEEGALIEPLSVAVHIVRQADVRAHSSVVVLGAGPVGLLCCAVARAFGARKIVSVDINEERLAFSGKYAATGTFLPSKAPPDETAARLVREHELGLGPDVAIDASGAAPSIQTAIHALRPGGTYVQAGMGAPDVNFPITLMCTKELSVRGSFRYGPGDYELSVAMVADGRVSVKELVTGRVRFRDAEEAFRDVKAGKGIKILIAGPGWGI
ncbi:MAG: hypothetical protein M1832_001720 [Thelocarpon impressellum]|nr:MAG: hypothetical protein M1832_001720 [Thelocarpon impressellum]